MTTPAAVAEMKCLIVDDHAGMRESIKRALRGVASQIIECTDGDEVCAAFSEHHPDWVLMDVRMARMDGITATRRLRGEHPEARVLIVTEQGAPELREAAFAAGARQCFQKDNLRQLRNFVSSVNASENSEPI
jgi:DNA-binding NarL/FixJ family response regulator